MNKYRILSLILIFLSIYADEKVKIEMFTESLCPACIRFMTSSLKPAIEAKDIDLIADIKLYPYGNARQSKSGEKWVFSCQHGENECAGNLMESCALSLNDYKLGLAFSVCLEDNLDTYSRDFSRTGTYCAEEVNINIGDILRCMQGDLGNQAQHEIASKTISLNPPHQHVPWIVVNEQHSSDTENQVNRDMLKFICKSYKGEVKIEACNKFLN